MRKFFDKNKSLGQAHGKRRYDLALQDSSGSGFLKLLIALMSTLTLLALATGFVLSDMSARWAAGIQNHLTIEIPPEDAGGKTLSQGRLDSLSEQARDIAREDPSIEQADIVPKEEVMALIAPWLGDDLASAENAIPLPALINVTVKAEADFTPDALQTRLNTLSPAIRVDTHESWMESVVRFTGALKAASYLVVLVILGTTIIAVAGAVRSKMAVHQDELELLHLMGAQDSYIMKQFQRFILWIALQGALLGCVLGALLLLMIDWMSGKMDIALLPDLSLSGENLLFLCLLPFFISFLAMGTSRLAVLRVLKEMP